PGTQSVAFSREKGLKDFGQRSFVNADAVIAHGHLKVQAGKAAENPGSLSVEMEMLRFDCQNAAARHGIPGVHHQVEDYLFDLVGVDLDKRFRVVENRADFNVLADHPADHLFEIVNQQVEVEYANVQRLLAAEHQKLPGQRRRTFRSTQDLLQAALRRVGFEQRQLREARDDGQQVVEVVSHAARQAADGLHLLRLPELLVHAPQLAPRLRLFQLAFDGAGQPREMISHHAIARARLHQLDDGF